MQDRHLDLTLGATELGADLVDLLCIFGCLLSHSGDIANISFKALTYRIRGGLSRGNYLYGFCLRCTDLLLGGRRLLEGAIALKICDSVEELVSFSCDLFKLAVILRYSTEQFSGVEFCRIENRLVLFVGITDDLLSRVGRFRQIGVCRIKGILLDLIRLLAGALKDSILGIENGSNGGIDRLALLFPGLLDLVV